VIHGNQGCAGLPLRLARPSRENRIKVKRSGRMFKLITIILAAIPVVLFLRAIFPGQSKKISRAMSDFKRQIDYLVWVMLFLIGCGLVYSVVKLALN
jgi:hypothetical protein